MQARFSKKIGRARRRVPCQAAKPTNLPKSEQTMHVPRLDVDVDAAVGRGGRGAGHQLDFARDRDDEPRALVDENVFDRHAPALRTSEQLRVVRERVLRLRNADRKLRRLGIGLEELELPERLRLEIDAIAGK